MTTVRDLLAEAKRLLAEAPFEPPTREAHHLLGHVLGLSEAQVLARYDAPVLPEAEAAFRLLLGRRLAGEPVAYLVGEREFYGRPIRVDPRVLIPRPETEHLVEAALDPELGLPAAARVLDVGTGSGAIALTLALERPDWRVVAADLSPAALALARENARRLGLLAEASPRLRLVASDLASALRLERFDLLVSNPPYVAREEAAALSPEVRDFEPHGALFGDEPSGTGIASRLLGGLEELPPHAPVILEIGRGRLDAMRQLAGRHGRRLARTIADYAGIPRVVVLTGKERKET